MKVLFISAWFPNRYDAMSGLCVQRQAKSIADLADVRVLYVHPNESANTFEIIENQENNFNSIIVYYPAKNNNVFQKIIKQIYYLRAYKKGYNYLKKQLYLPDIVHANILTRTVIVAYIYKLWKGTPYIISEHFSRYLPNRNEYKGILRKFLTKKVVKHASAVFPVSAILKNALLDNNLYNPNYKVIYNSVDNIFFSSYPVYSRDKKRILHVSCFNEKAKNVKGILNVIKKLKDYRNDFELIIIGMGDDYNEVYEYAKSLNILDVVHFKGELPPKEVAEWFTNSDFFVLFSNYETASVVLAESLSMGKPVITSRVGGAPEWIDKNNGITVEPKNEQELKSAIDYMLDNFKKYDSGGIRNSAYEKFNYQNIGRQLFETYKRILNS